MFRLVLLTGLASLLFACTNHGTSTTESTNEDSIHQQPPMYDSVFISLSDTTVVAKFHNIENSDSGLSLIAKAAPFVLQSIPSALTAKAPVFSVVAKWKDVQADIQNTVVKMRFSGDAKSWSDWDTLHNDLENEKEGDSVFYTTPFFLKAGTKYFQLELHSNLNKNGLFPTGVEVFFIYQKADTLKSFLEDSLFGQSIADGCACVRSPFVSRTQWKCPTGQFAPDWAPVRTTATHIVIHHSESGEPASGNWLEGVYNIWVYHATIRKWGDIGYNWLIDPDGTVYEGRAGSDYGKYDIIGAHMCARNQNTVGICMLGSYMHTSLTTKARKGLIGHSAWKCCVNGIDPLATMVHPGASMINTVSGHRSGCAVGYTECPGDKLFADLASIRTAIRDSIANCKTP